MDDPRFQHLFRIQCQKQPVAKTPRENPRFQGKRFSLNRSLRIAGLLFLSHLYCEEPAVSSNCSQGNFALSLSQQPAPLVSFGENIIGKNQVQLFLYGDDLPGQNQNFIDLIPSVLWGITDNFSLFVNFPFTPSYQSGSSASAGLEDWFIQLEYAFFSATYGCDAHQATLVADVSFPTGSSHKSPPTGFGSTAYFLGTTYNFTTINWFCFTSYGAELPTGPAGNQYLYQFGFGRNIANVNNWLFAWMAEIDGTFYAHDKPNGKIDPNSGGNVIYLTPSFWASSETWMIQLGAGYAIQQNLFGDQIRDEYYFAFNLGWTFP